MSSGTGHFPEEWEYLYGGGGAVGYHICYDEEPRTGGTGRKRRWILTLFFLFCFFWVVSACWPEGREILKFLMIPGDPDQTLQAAEVFAQEIGSGFALGDAARNFCIAVLEHGYSG